MEVEGVRVHLRRIGEPITPHEVHLILPRTEIRKFQPAGECGPTEVQIMLSNLNVVLSPRLVSGDGDSIEQGKVVQTKTQDQTTQQLSQTKQQEQNQQTQFDFIPQYGQGAL